VDLLDRLSLDVPVCQAGMGGGLAGPELAAAVAAAGGLGTLGLAPPEKLREWISRVRTAAPGRAVAVNLLTPFLRHSQVSVCVRAGVDVAVVAFGGDRQLIDELSDAGVFVFVMVGSEEQAHRAVAWGADGLIAQGGEAGGHLCGTTGAHEFLPRALAIADGRPVLLAGGIATGSDTEAALSAGASGVIAGTRFLLTHESRAHPEYQRRILAADRTIRTNLFGLSWPAPHRVIPNAATERWCRADGSAKVVPRSINGGSAFLARLPATPWVSRMQTLRLPLFSPVAPTVGMPSSAVDRAACYAGESAMRMNSVTSARQAVADLAPGGQ
jgi:NAD(P)H-dependent flavin oxidoreductase YrpB (nitropropane dioxygenase family)